MLHDLGPYKAGHEGVFVQTYQPQADFLTVFLFASVVESSHHCQRLRSPSPLKWRSYSMVRSFCSKPAGRLGLKSKGREGSKIKCVMPAAVLGNPLFPSAIIMASVQSRAVANSDRYLDEE